MNMKIINASHTGRELKSEGQFIPPKWDDMEVSTDPVDSGEDVPDDLASSSCNSIDYCQLQPL